MSTEPKSEFTNDEVSIRTAGVMRCCLKSIADEFDNKTTKLGDKTECKYCHTEFTLVNRAGWECPVWYPDWQLKDLK